jgi:hypothetical protein
LRKIHLRKKAIACIGILSMLLLVTAAYNPASALTYAAGVKPGDTATYNVSLTPYPDSVKMHIFVFGVTGTTVTLNVSFTQKNGTETKPFQTSGDVATGGALILWLLAKNLTTNNPLYSGSDLAINGTTTMSVGGQSRTVNYLNITGFGIVGNMYWDKDTGILVKSNLGIIFVGWWNTTLNSTSLWSPGLFGLSYTTIAIIGGGVVVLIALIVILRRKH